MTTYDNHQMVFLNEGKNTTAYFALKKPKGLIIFVHGLGGHATTTWKDFPIIVKNFTEFNDYDVIFYGYSSLDSGASSNALLFYNSLKKFVIPPVEFLGIQREVLSSYEKIIIAAHSLGAVVTRRALLFANSEKAEWLSLCKMFLLAPAHKGSSLQGMVYEILPYILKVATTIYKYRHPVINDLEFDSVTLKSLKKESEKLLRKKKGDFTISAAVLWSLNDKVVLNEPFCMDVTPELEMEKDHMGVCKLDLGSYMKPFDELKKLMCYEESF
ncbi:MAG: hypothetical protein IPL84_02795 [Chitinophagaceae bacterium]|nr:hypothetical protein [Chitinophagaceae bacterium]